MVAGNELDSAKEAEDKARRKREKKARQKARREQEGVTSSGKASKRAKAGAYLSLAAEVHTPGQLSDRTFDVDPNDHCETPFEAYRDIEPLLFALGKKLGKSKAELQVYDPFYCEGSVVAHLKRLGLEKVYNRKEDFYAAQREGRVPAHDVLVTNPPFSADHLERTLRFAAHDNHGRPFLLLLPNFVWRKKYYEAAVEGTSPVFLIPAKRYTFWSPVRAELRGRPEHERGRPASTTPFECFWYLSLGPWTEELVQAWRRKHEVQSGCTLVLGADAARAGELPERAVPPKNHEKRANPKARRKLRKKGRTGALVAKGQIGVGGW